MNFQVRQFLTNWKFSNVSLECAFLEALNIQEYVFHSVKGDNGP